MEIKRYAYYDFMARFMRHDIVFKTLMENTVDISEIREGDMPNYYEIIIKLPDNITY